MVSPNHYTFVIYCCLLICLCLHTSIRHGEQQQPIRSLTYQMMVIAHEWCRQPFISSLWHFMIDSNLCGQLYVGYAAEHSTSLGGTSYLNSSIILASHKNNKLRQYFFIAAHVASTAQLMLLKSAG